MSRDDVLKQLLSTRPPESGIADAAERARRLALGRLDTQRFASPRALRWPILATASALMTCGVLLIWRADELPVSPTMSPVAVEGTTAQPVRIMLTLDDGTRVSWTIDSHYSL